MSTSLSTKTDSDSHITCVRCGNKIAVALQVIATQDTLPIERPKTPVPPSPLIKSTKTEPVITPAPALGPQSIFTAPQGMQAPKPHDGYTASDLARPQALSYVGAFLDNNMNTALSRVLEIVREHEHPSDVYWHVAGTLIGSSYFINKRTCAYTTTAPKHGHIIYRIGPQYARCTGELVTPTSAPPVLTPTLDAAEQSIKATIAMLKEKNLKKREAESIQDEVISSDDDEEVPAKKEPVSKKKKIGRPRKT
jgi:hypothetical protein